MAALKKVAKKVASKKTASKKTATKKTASKKVATKKTTAKKAPKTSQEKFSETKTSHGDSHNESHNESHQDALYSCLEAFDEATTSFAKGMGFAADYLCQQWEDGKTSAKSSFEDFQKQAKIYGKGAEEMAQDYTEKCKKWGKDHPAEAVAIASTVVSVLIAFLTKATRR